MQQTQNEQHSTMKSKRKEIFKKRDSSTALRSRGMMGSSVNFGGVCLRNRVVPDAGLHGAKGGSELVKAGAQAAIWGCPGSCESRGTPSANILDSETQAEQLCEVSYREQKLPQSSRSTRNPSQFRGFLSYYNYHILPWIIMICGPIFYLHPPHLEGNCDTSSIY